MVEYILSKEEFLCFAETIDYLKTSCEDITITSGLTIQYSNNRMCIYQIDYRDLFEESISLSMSSVFNNSKLINLFKKSDEIKIITNDDNFSIGDVDAGGTNISFKYPERGLIRNRFIKMNELEELLTLDSFDIISEFEMKTTLLRKIKAIADTLESDRIYFVFDGDHVILKLNKLSRIESGVSSNLSKFEMTSNVLANNISSFSISPFISLMKDTNVKIYYNSDLNAILFNVETIAGKGDKTINIKVWGKGLLKQLNK